jgi:sec-independent protein translocase protein TatC
MARSDSSESSMSFLDHLRELRSSLTFAVSGIFITSLACLYWAPEIFTLLTIPIRENFGSLEMIGTGPAEAFIIKLKTALIAGLILSSPHTFFQVWRFISPAMYENERKIAIPFVLVSSVLFLSGAAFCFFIMFPYAFQYFSGEYQQMGIQPNIKVDEYISFVLRLVFVFGMVFELPVVCFFMARMRLVTHTWLYKNGRFGILLIFIFAAILTPPDIISQLLLALPLIVIYILCIGIAYISHPEKTPLKKPG